MPRNKKSTPAEVTEQVESQTEVVFTSPADGQSSDTPAASGFGKQEASGRQRGPVEEVIAKRVRQLGKKIQRFRGYANQVEKLNADQKSAIASLPILEAQSRELEDLIKSGGPIEVAELGESAKLRGLKEEAEKNARSDAQTSSSSFQTSVTQPLSLFLRLYTLLHPARSGDHQNLTFSPLSLPSELQDEVRATDILRVGKMWESLLAGGEAGAEVLEGLVKGQTGVDEEDDHIHVLLKLLSESSEKSSEPVSENVAEEKVESQTAPASESGKAAEEPTSIIQPEAETEVQSSSEPKVNGEEPRSSTAGGGGMFNFLQEDELHGDSAPKEEVGEGFEMVEQPAAHETEDYDVPTPAPAASTSAPEAVAEPESATFDWADEDEAVPATSATVEPTSESPTPAPAPASGDIGSTGVVASITESIQAIATAITDKIVPSTETAGETSAPVEGNGRSLTTRGGKRGGNNPRRGRPNGVSGQQQHQQQGQQQQVGIPIPSKPTTGNAKLPNKPERIIDEDGFEMKVKVQPKSRGGASGAGAGGRGGRGGAGPGAGGEGRVGRGRGGAGRGGPGRASTNGPTSNGGGQKPSGQAQLPPKPQAAA